MVGIIFMGQSIEGFQIKLIPTRLNLHLLTENKDLIEINKTFHKTTRDRFYRKLNFQQNAFWYFIL